MKKNLILILILLLEIACKKSEPMQWLHILQGTWSASFEEEQKGYEIWQKLNDSTLAGEGFLLTQEGDTLFKEHMLIVKRGTIILYRAYPDKQAKPTDFYLNIPKSNEHTFIFENPLNEFPCTITYKFYSNEKMEIHTRGTYQNKESEIAYLFYKQTAITR